MIAPDGPDAADESWLQALAEEALRDPGRYRRRVVLVAAAGLLYPVTLMLGVAGFGALTVLSAPYLSRWEAPGVPSGAGISIWLALAAVTGLFAWAVAGAIFTDPGVRPGQRLGDGEGAGLRAVVEEIRTRLGGVRVDEIRILMNFNASVVQSPAKGLLGRTENVLMVGLPLLLLISRDELADVLAHEFGHLAQDHGVAARWVYGLRQTWHELGKNPLGGKSLSWWALGWFLQRYPKHLEAVALPWCRGHEVQADRLAGAARGAERMARTLIKIELWSSRLGREFWPRVYETASSDPLPPTDVMSRLAAARAQPLDDAWLGRWIERELRRGTSLRASHPCLRERLESLGCAAMLSDAAALRAAWDCGEASALEVLGEESAHLLDRANRLWKASHAFEWRLRNRWHASYPDLEADAAAELTRGVGLLELDDAAGLVLVNAAVARCRGLALAAMGAVERFHRERGEDAAADRAIAALIAMLGEIPPVKAQVGGRASWSSDSRGCPARDRD